MNDNWGWNFVITLWNEEGEDQKYFTRDSEKVKKFMAKIEYVDMIKVEVECNSGIYLEEKCL